MYVGYFDEFGHNGLYVGRHDARYKTHPVFGLGGFIIPADNVRRLSGAFRYIKESGLNVVPADNLDDAAQKIVKAVKEAA